MLCLLLASDVSCHKDPVPTFSRGRFWQRRRRHHRRGLLYRQGAGARLNELTQSVRDVWNRPKRMNLMDLISIRRWPAMLAVLLWWASLGEMAADQEATSLFYDPEVVQTIRLEIQPEDLDRLQRALPERIYVPGTFRWNDVALYPVGVRYKGNSSSHPDSPHKRSFLIEFAEFKTGQRFLGLRHVALDNGIQFGGLFSERLITDVLRELGVKASRCNYARVFLNGKPAGVYVNVSASTVRS